MMREGTARICDGRRPVGVPCRPESGLAGKAGIDLPEPLSAQAPLVVHGEFHDEIM